MTRRLAASFLSVINSVCTRQFDEALCTPWDRQLIRAYAESNSWDQRMQPLIDAYHQLLSTRPRRAYADAC